MIDFHCHLDLYAHPHKIVATAQRRGIGVLSVTTTPSAWPGTSRLAQGHSFVRTALGLHPQLAEERGHELKVFEKYLGDTRFVGEVGVDGSSELKSTWAQQVKIFEHILHACDEAGNKVLSIHSRRAATAVLDLLDKFDGVNSPILHWFSGSPVELQRAVDRGCWFSVGPAMLGGVKGRALVGAMPRDRVLLETDGPFAQHRRATLNPWDIGLASQSLSEVWATDLEEVERIIRANEMSVLSTSIE
ncbi:Qat anti-phage system TatD family nuclease QatD [Actinoplanes sp. NPDC000266]